MFVDTGLSKLNSKDVLKAPKGSTAAGLSHCQYELNFVVIWGKQMKFNETLEFE